ncbi:DUF6542 domain-containing protein [Corynebacterium aquatimens]|uniref:Uncharacterized protein (DUF2062 family) n=1 Tax=Corynebacterium aquatimens TaxID=1190508 RepID=A0A931DTN0_9CORY|nr:DUF6542 domain-containing protein [Corynebacterium aquatimens]MBG6121224.1 uncharacterized protein (DUF2062 family) [Corynebacterium aquatimens]
MSHLTNRKNSQSKETFDGLSIASGVGIIAAALITGALLAMHFGSLGWPFLTLYIVAVVAVTTLVNPRGLFLVVASAPIMYLIALLSAGVVNALQQRPPGQSGLGKTSAVTILYPLVQFFPVLITVTVGSVIIAVMRYWLLKRHNEEISRLDERRRRQISEDNERTVRQASRSRNRASTRDEARSGTSAATRAGARASNPCDRISSSGGSTRVSRDKQVTVKELLERAPQRTSQRNAGQTIYRSNRSGRADRTAYSNRDSGRQDYSDYSPRVRRSRDRAPYSESDN